MIIFLSILTVLMAVLLFFLAGRVFKLKKQLKTKPSKLTKEEKKKLEAAKEAFNNLMEYGYEDAIKRK